MSYLLSDCDELPAACSVDVEAAKGERRPAKGFFAPVNGFAAATCDCMSALLGKELARPELSQGS